MSIDPIVQQLRAARLAARRSQREVGVSAGLNQATICEAETGKHGATLASARRWAAALGFELVLREVGPGSTYPEPGPTTCPDYPDCSEERLVRDMDASVRLGEPVGRWTSGCAACGTLTKGDLE